MFMTENSVVFKGTVNGLTIILKPDCSFEDIVESMKIKVSGAGKFFRGSKLAVRYKGRVLQEQEKEQLHQILIRDSGATILSFEEEVDNHVASTPATANSSTERNNQIKKYMYFKGIEEGQTKFHKGTLRSGQLITFDGNLVILGDVNPGAVVEATGNIVVMGLLRGVVHAGSDGNKDAIVAALGLHPTQLRIADIITRPPDEKGTGLSMIPEMAYIKDDMLIVDRFLPTR